VTFEIVFVCTGNRARSPVAAAFLQSLVADLPVRVSSVGTLPLGAIPALPEAVKAAARLGVDLSTHQARWIGDHPLRDADAVVGFERAHVAAAVVEHGADPRRAFTLAELVALLEASDPPDELDAAPRARAAIRLADSLRRSRDIEPAEEIADPLGRPKAVFRRTAEQTYDLVGRLAAGLFGEHAVQGRQAGPGRPA
jgi:protein-tyrosine phosphatase